METIDIAITSDNRAYCGLLVAACTAASCATKGVKLIFHILDGGITDDNFSFFETKLALCNVNATVDRIRVSNDTFDGFPFYRGCKITYARLILPRVLPSVNRVIYFDADFYWRADILQVWNETKDIRSFAAALDQNPGGDEKERKWFERNGLTFPVNRYVCAGLCVINLNQWRTDKVMERALDFLHRYPTVECADQTALNAILTDDEVRVLPLHWGRFVRHMTPVDFQKPTALHFSAEAPWIASHFTHMMTDAQLLWFKTDAELRGISVWRSLRHFYSTREIIGYRVIYLFIMRIAPIRLLFHWYLARTGRCFFDERI